MGSFYGSAAVLGSSHEAVVDAAKRGSFVASEGDVAVVFNDQLDRGLPDLLLSAELGSPTLQMLVHDSDILAVLVFVKGELVFEAAFPDPRLIFGEEFGEMAGEDDPGADYDALASSLVSLLGRGDLKSVRAALTDDFVFAEERHAALLDALGLPTWSASLGFNYLASDSEMAETLPNLVRVK